MVHTQLSRRMLLAGAAATGATAMMTTAAGARGTFFVDVGLPIGLQIYTLGDDAGRDLDATFAQVAEIGYRDIELPGLYNQEPAAIKAAADRAGLQISSLHLSPRPGPSNAIQSEAAALAEIVSALGAHRVVLPILLFPENMQFQAGDSMQTAISRAVAGAGEDIWKRTAALLNEKGAALKALGASLGYHNHNLEFAPIGQTTGWEILQRETDPDVVDFEIDVGWVAAAGLDPVSFLNGLRGRVTQLHVKDLKATTTTNFALQMDPSEVGAGTQDWRRILPAAHRAGVRHFYVEQEPPFAMPRIESARESYRYLAALCP